MLRRRLVLAPVLAALGAAAIGVPASEGAKQAKHARVTVADCYCYEPGKLTVTSGTKVTFKWAKGLSAPHNFHLIKAPKHVKHFKVGTKHSGAPVHKRAPFTFTLRKVGTYKFQCDLHTYMHLKIKVTK